MEKDRDQDKTKAKRKVIDSKDLLMMSLSKFYNIRGNINKIICIIEGSSDISLRLIDWFVTNFSKKYNTVITKQHNNNVLHFNVYLSYRNQLKAYSKQLFDPFRRRDRISFHYDRDKKLETTIGQLNFFRWILQNDILEYISANVKEIEADMMKTQRENMKKKNEEENMKIKEIVTDKGVIYQKRKKRNQLSKSSVKNMNMMAGPRVIQFN